MSDEPFDPVDALGEQIQVGKLYGYSSTASGIARTVIGEAKSFTKTGLVKLKIAQVKIFLYGRPTDIHSTNTEVVNIRPHLLFPVESFKNEDVKNVAWTWVCNQCGASEYTSALSEDDVHQLSCGRCGGDEWHRETV